MSLEDLSHYVPAQTLKIDKLVARKGYFSRSTPFVSSWDAFRRSVWRKGLASFGTEEPVERGDDPVSEQAPTTRMVMKISSTTPTDWDLGTKRILVCPKYEEAERAALSANACTRDVFFVTGHPGIGWASITPSPPESNLWPGKSVFLA